ncbi:MAG: vancomycin resistance protein VanW [Myxococcota bacterium]|jgi:vancomycin resistance protein VanW
MPAALKSLPAPLLALRQARIDLARTRRLLRWKLRPHHYPEPRLARPGEQFELVHGTTRSPLLRRDSFAHPVLEAGKLRNVLLAAPAFDGLVVSSDRPLSFWRTLGPATASRGFVSGMELAGGCVVPSVGGGLCVVSNAIFALAARLGWRILERHGHSVEAVPWTGDQPWGLDATVFWPHVDLVVAPRHGSARLSAEVEADALVLKVEGQLPLEHRAHLESIDGGMQHNPGDEAVRTNRILRRLMDCTTGRLLDTEVIAVNRKRIRHGAAQGRNCLTCDEHGCATRSGAIAGLVT